MKDKIGAFKMRALGIAVLVTAIVFGFAACDDGNNNSGGFVAVTNITGISATGTVGTPLPLNGTVVPSNATNKTIIWSVQSLGTTGATISGNTLNTTAAGTVVVKATITNGATESTPYTKDFNITVSAGSGTALTITTDARLPGGTVDKAYSQTLTASGGTPITWSLDGGTTLPAGLDLAGTTGIISGIPMAANTYTFTVKAANEAGNNVTKQLSITITKTFSDSGTDFEMAWMKSGTFTMGSPTSEEYRTASNETQHSVTLTKGFYMSIYPVTQAQYEAVMESNPSAHRVGGSRVSYLGGITDTTNFPVDTITWYNALVFCNKLSMIEGLTPAYSIKNSTDPADWGSVPGSSNSDWSAALFDENSTGYRLPTDAQWEYACRAGTITAFNTGNTISDNTGWYSANSGNRTHSVGGKPANAWGLYDMHGNVEEWCWDGYDNNYGGEAGVSATDPTGPDSHGNRVARGGSWYAGWTFSRSAYRDSTPPYYATNNTYGLRIVRPAPVTN